MTSVQKTKRYERIRRLGKDGPFELEVAWPLEGKNVEQAVLLKRLQIGWQVHPDDISAFIADTLVVSLVFHPNVLRVIDAGAEEGRLYIITEYTHGVSLSSILRRLSDLKVPLPLGFVLDVVSEISAGLARVAGGGDSGGPQPEPDHDSGLVHGALGTDHVLITFDGKVKLKDFGIYRLYKSRSSPGESASIGLDLAPELRDGQAPDERTDLYGLGLMIQRLVAKSPAAAETADLRSAILEISKRLLKLAPDERYQSAGEVLIALRDCPQPSPQAWRRDQLGSWARKMFDSGLGEKEEPVNNENPADPGSHVEKVGLLDPAVFWGAVEPTGSAAAPDRIEAQEFAPASESPESGVVEYSDPDMQFEDDTEEVSSLQIPAPSPSPPEPRKPPEVLPVAPPPAPPAQVKTRQTGMRPSSRPVKKPARGGGPGGAMWAMIAFVVLGVGGLLFLFLGQKTSRNADDDSGELVVEQAQKEPGGGQTAGETRPVPDRKTSKENKVPELSGLRKGSLRLTSDPSGVAVFIDGEKRGATPTELKEITLGSTITVRMELEGYRPWEQKIEFDHEDPDREIHAGLVRKIKCDKGSGWIYISTNPAGAVVEMDGKRLPGKTPMVVNDVCAGVNHNYRVKLAGYKTWWRDATVSPSQVLNMKVELSK